MCQAGARQTRAPAGERRTLGGIEAPEMVPWGGQGLQRQRRAPACLPQIGLELREAATGPPTHQRAHTCAHPTSPAIWVRQPVPPLLLRATRAAVITEEVRRERLERRGVSL